jgi:hypothetical protein
MTPVIITLLITLLIGIWILCGLISFGVCLAHFQREYPLIAEKRYHENVLFALKLSFWGPASLLGVLTATGIKHGAMFSR